MIHSSEGFYGSNAAWQLNRLYQDERPTGPPDGAPSSSSAAEPFAFTETLPVQREANISSSLSTPATPRWGQTTLTEGRGCSQSTSGKPPDTVVKWICLKILSNSHRQGHIFMFLDF